MKRGTTSSGFRYEFDEARLDDMRFVDVLATVLDPEGSPFERASGVSRLITMLIGPEMKKALYEHIGQAHEGRVPQAELEKALEEIMAGAGEDAEKNC